MFDLHSLTSRRGERYGQNFTTIFCGIKVMINKTIIFLGNRMALTAYHSIHSTTNTYIALEKHPDFKKASSACQLL